MYIVSRSMCYAFDCFISKYIHVTTTIAIIHIESRANTPTAPIVAFAARPSPQTSGMGQAASWALKKTRLCGTIHIIQRIAKTIYRFLYFWDRLGTQHTAKSTQILAFCRKQIECSLIEGNAARFRVGLGANNMGICVHKAAMATHAIFLFIMRQAKEKGYTIYLNEPYVRHVGAVY